MWCTNCQQDVPALAHGDLARCAQCGRFLKRRADEHSTDVASFVTAGESESRFAAASVVSFTEPTAPDDDWTLDQRVRHLQRRLRLDEAATAPRIFHNAIPNAPADLNPSLMPGRSPTSSQSHVAAVFAWIMIALGSLAFVCGAALLTWWFVDRSRELWNFGVPLILLGQFGLLLGQVLQLNNLRRINRHATEALERVDRQLQQMNHGAPLLKMPHASPHAFTHPSHSPATRFSHS